MSGALGGFPTDDDGEVSHGRDGRRPKAYVRFDQRHVNQTGPMHGPFDGLEVKNDVIHGWRKTGPIRYIAERRSDGLWYLSDAMREPGYFGFSVIFS